MDKQAEAVTYIHNQAWSGFYREDEIVEAVAETVFYPDPIDEEWVRRMIQGEFLAKKQAEATWPKTTDCDRLDRVFTALENHNILVLENAGYDNSDGITDVTEAWYGLGAEDSDIAGYCFYHGQDLEYVMTSGELYLTFGDILGTDDKGTEIGRLIVNELRAIGFTVEWDGSIKTRIVVKSIKWLRRMADNES